MYLIKIIFSFFLVWMLSSCAYIYGDTGFVKNRDTDYLSAKSIPPLKIPPGLSSDLIEAHYPVSERQYPANTKKPSIMPPGL